MIEVAIVRKTLRDLRGQVLGWGLGLAILAALLVLLFPAIGDEFEGVDFESFEGFFGEIDDLSNPRSFLQIEFFTWTPVLLAVFAILAGTGALAGEEGAGTLELLLAQPISRRRLLLAKAVGVAVAATAIVVLAGLGFLVTAPFVDLEGEVSAWELAISPLSVLPFTISCAALSMLAATLTPTRSMAAGLMAAETVAVYVLNVLSELADPLHWLRYLSPFHYSDARQVLTVGVVWWHQALLLGAGLFLVALALAAFERREIGTGRSPLRALLGRETEGEPEASPAPRAG